MPEILLNANATPHLRRASIIAIKPDGWLWGKEERTNRFFRITVTGITVEELEQYLEVIYDAEDNVLEKRRFHIAPNVVNQIAQAGGELTIAVSGFSGALVDKL